MRRKLIGKCSVDSGQIMLVDPCYVLPHPQDDDVDALVAKLSEYGLTYEDACEVTCGEDGAGPLGRLACVTGTGWGDGVYPVYVDYDDVEGRIAAVHIHFLDPPDPENWPTDEEPERELDE